MPPPIDWIDMFHPKKHKVHMVIHPKTGDGYLERWRGCHGEYVRQLSRMMTRKSRAKESGGPRFGVGWQYGEGIELDGFEQHY